MKKRVLILFCLCFFAVGCDKKQDEVEGLITTYGTEEAFHMQVLPEEAETESLETEVVETYVDTVLTMAPGAVVAPEFLQQATLGNLFTVNVISQEIIQRITGISYVENPNISLDELRYLRLLYYGFDGNTYVGEMIVNEQIAEEVTSIFRRLYEEKYPIEQMVLIDDYQGEDEASMDANNTTAFNYRTVAGSSKLSNHSYGMAIDLNPKYNPYVKEKTDGTLFCQPALGAEYADRDASFEHKITREDLACKLFLEAGFTWGGDWNSVKDYQHFEKE